MRAFSMCRFLTTADGTIYSALFIFCFLAFPLAHEREHGTYGFLIYFPIFSNFSEEPQKVCGMVELKDNGNFL